MAKKTEMHKVENLHTPKCWSHCNCGVQRLFCPRNTLQQWWNAWKLQTTGKDNIYVFNWQF